jgi:peptidyl-prolyl cis-trans isomerase D
MPLMTKIRENMATFFSIFAGVFVVYIVLDWGMDITGRKQANRRSESQEIGKINGEPILAKDFADMIKRAVENQKAQTGTEPDDNQQKAIREQVWNQLVDQMLYDKEIDRLGIKVTDQEIIDWVRGDNPPDFLKQRFTDSTGTFLRQEYEQAILDPKNKATMVLVEDALRKQRLREKLQSLITATVVVSDGEVTQRYLDQNIKYDADFALFDPNVMVKDNEVTVNDDDIKRFYNEHSDDYKVEASRKLKYVLFEDIPSKDDTVSVENDMQDILNRTKAGVDFDTLAKMYSDVPPTAEFHPHGTLAPEVERAAFSAKAGEIVGPVKTADAFHLLKVIEFKNGKDEFYHASHILIQITNNDSVAALKQAKEILAMANGQKDFASIARQYSDDHGTGANGGDVGWLGKGRMVKPFEEAVMKARVGQIVGPVRSQQGYHLIKVLGKDNREVKFTDISLPIRVSGRTRNDNSQHAQDFVYLAKQSSFETEAEQSKYKILETPSFQKDAVIPGIGMNMAANKFAFKNKVGAISDPFSIQRGYAVFMLSEIKEAGIRPLDEVKTVIESRVKMEKKIERVFQIAQELRASLSPTDNIQSLQSKNPSVSVQHLAQFTLTGYIPNVGRDLSFSGALSGMGIGETSKPVKSDRRVFIIKLLSKSAFDTTAFSAQKEAFRGQMLTEKKNRFFADWSEQVKKSADIVDNRDMFYR